jgi:hypothetical protein
MKKGFLVLTAVFALLFASFAADAAPQTFGPISVDVPNGWQVEESETQLSFKAPDNTAAVTIILEELEDSTVEEMAEEVSEGFNGTPPEAGPAGGFVFSFKNENGVNCNAFISGDEDEGYVVLVIAAGEHPQLAALLDSIEVVQ